MQAEDSAIAFRCGGDTLYGILSLPAQPARRGVLVVVGGPQYRAGSHRQFALLARELAQQGIAAMRFDYRGMGDSEGEPRPFDDIGDDLRAALDAFVAGVPGMEEVVLWGLCDGASAAAMYAPGDARVRGLVLLNPWVRTPAGIARTTLKHYYRGRLLEPALWKKVLRGHFNVRAAAASMLALVSSARKGEEAGEGAAPSLPERMLDGLSHFPGRVLVILSGADLTANEFSDMAAASPAWRDLLATPRITQRRLERADHTFSRRAWRQQVADWTADWTSSEK